MALRSLPNAMHLPLSGDSATQVSAACFPIEDGMISTMKTKTLLRALCAVPLLAIMVSFQQLPASAQAADEADCLAGNAEACFYTAAAYANGDGVEANKQTTAKYFLKACEMGIPDGCTYAGSIYLRGEDNVEQDLDLAIHHYETACSMAHMDGCNYAYSVTTNPKYGVNDPARAMRALTGGCEAGYAQACSWAAGLGYDGADGKFPDFTDWAGAAPNAASACEADDKYYCLVASILFANPESPAFDAQRSIRYLSITCDDGVATNCQNLGAIYQGLEEWELAATSYEKACSSSEKKACDHAQDVRRYLREEAERERILAERESTMNSLISSGRYADAVHTALYDYGSVRLAERAVTSAANAGALSSISTQDLYGLASWALSGAASGAVNRELANRGTGLEGRFGEGTNTPGAAARRYQELYGASAPGYSASAGPPPPSKPMLSAAEASAQTKAKYRSAWCTMNGNANRNVCN